jgi:hypothetical protein
VTPRPYLYHDGNTGRLFYILAFFIKKITFDPLARLFSRLDPRVGAICLSAMIHGIEMPRALPAWRRCGSQLGAVDRGAELAVYTTRPSSPVRTFILYFLSCRFFCLSPTRPTSSIDVFDLKTLICFIGLQEQGILSPLLNFYVLIWSICIIQCNCLGFRI